MDCRSHKYEDFTMEDNVLDGIKEMKARNRGRFAIQQYNFFNAEYLESGKGSSAVRDFLLKAGNDDDLLLRFLKGRKYRPKHAFETIKRNGEVRFDTYPEIFPPTFPNEALSALQDNVIGILKGRDSEGRRVVYMNGNKWDTGKLPFELFTIVAVQLAECLLRDDDAMNNGIVFVQDCSGLGMRHVKEYTFSSMHRLINVFWYAFPLKLKGVYYVNAPSFLSYVFGLIRPFFPKKLKERFIVTSPGNKFETLHKTMSSDILPKYLGGTLEADEVTDRDILQGLMKQVVDEK